MKILPGHWWWGAVCIGGTQFVCAGLFCPFSDFLECLFVEKPTESQKVKSILFVLVFISLTIFFLYDTVSSIIQLVCFVASIEYFWKKKTSVGQRNYIEGQWGEYVESYAL